MTEHSDAINAAEGIIKEGNSEDDLLFQVMLPRRLAIKLSNRFAVAQAWGNEIAMDIENDNDLLSKRQDVSSEQKELWQKLIQGRHDDMRAILGKRFKEALASGAGIGLVSVVLCFREIDYLGRSRMEIISEESEDTDPVKERILKARRLMGYGTWEEEAKDFLGINLMFVEAGGRDNVELREFYVGLLRRDS